MITGSIRRRTSANVVRMRGEISSSAGWNDGSAGAPAPVAFPAPVARPDLVVGGMKRGVGGDARLDRLLGVGCAAEREQAKGAVLLDDRRLARRMLARAKPVQRDQRVFVGGRRVELTRRGEVPILRCRGRGRQDSRGDERSNPRRRAERLHFFLKSTLRRAGVVNVTVTLWRCSPRSGLRNTTS